MTPFEFIYYLGYTVKKKYSLSHRKVLPHKVISIGNLTVGGTGKTPAVIAVAEEAKKRGYRPVILTRGYRGNAKGPCLVSNGSAALLSVEAAGDEPVVMADRLKDVLVVKSADRYEGGVFAMQQPRGDDPNLLFILDDGFQHWRLSRDVDIVLVDGQNPFGNRKMLPVGPLRGPLSELKDADILVITKAGNEALALELHKMNGDVPVFSATHEVTGIRQADGAAADFDLLKGEKVLAFCGIANPASFTKTLSLLGCKVVELKQYRDHYRYCLWDIRGLEERGKRLGVEFLLTTEKDMVKIRELKFTPSNLLSVEIGFSIDKRFYDEAFKKVAR
ncbi:MAG: tetraacyldisaccharide 4'-kinase [Dissulfurispiraceae bacterium]